jgi:hypothetical protein
VRQLVFRAVYPELDGEAVHVACLREPRHTRAHNHKHSSEVGSHICNATTHRSRGRQRQANASSNRRSSATPALEGCSTGLQRVIQVWIRISRRPRRRRERLEQAEAAYWRAIFLCEDTRRDYPAARGQQNHAPVVEVDHFGVALRLACRLGDPSFVSTAHAQARSPPHVRNSLSIFFSSSMHQRCLT